MTYNELHYERIDLNKSKKKLANMIRDFKNSESATDQIDMIQKIDNFSRDYMTFQSMASLNFSKNRETYDIYNKVLHESKFKKEIIREYGETFLKKIEVSLKTFNSKIKEMLKDEIELKNDYTKLTAGAKIHFEGKDYNLAGLGPFHSDIDRSIRKKSYEARFKWFNKNQDELDSIYDRLVKLRHKIAITLEFSS